MRRPMHDGHTPRVLYENGIADVGAAGEEDDAGDARLGDAAQERVARDEEGRPRLMGAELLRTVAPLLVAAVGDPPCGDAVDARPNSLLSRWDSE